MKPSDCQHEWLKDKLGHETCMWCGIPKVRPAGPIPRLKIPRAERSPYAGTRPTRWKR